MVRYLLITLSFLLLGSFGASAQGTLQGKVTENESGLGAIGATVLVKRGGVQITGGVTDFDGNYSIQVSEGAVLEISFIGYQTMESTVGSSDAISVSLQADNELD